MAFIIVALLPSAGASRTQSHHSLPWYDRKEQIFLNVAACVNSDSRCLKHLSKLPGTMCERDCIDIKCCEFDLCDLLGRIISLSWHPSGTLIAAGMMDMIRIFDSETGEKTQLDPEAISTELALS